MQEITTDVWQNDEVDEPMICISYLSVNIYGHQNVIEVEIMKFKRETRDYGILSRSITLYSL